MRFLVISREGGNSQNYPKNLCAYIYLTPSAFPPRGVVLLWNQE